MWGALIGIFGFIIKKLFGAPAAPVAQQLGQAQNQTLQESAANDQLQAAARARADADAQRVRSDPNAGKVTADPAAAINRDPDAHFRD